jgi:hypothetical protein
MPIEVWIGPAGCMLWPPLPPRRYPLYSFLLQAESRHGNSVAGKIKTMKNPIDPIRNQTHDLPACSAVLQPTAPPRAPPTILYVLILFL